jgi:hypothetical protein
MDRTGLEEARTSRELLPQGHLAVFAHELFSNISDGFTGLVEIRTSIPVAAVTLKLTVNVRGDLVLTTLPIADLTKISTSTQFVFQHLATGAGFTTRLVLINPSTIAGGGRLAFLRSDATPLNLPLGGEAGSHFTYRLFASGARQFLPGDTTSLASILVLDRLTNAIVREIVVNEAGIVRPRIRLIDSAGHVRDDFDPVFSKRKIRHSRGLD